jgi:glycosyltransferase involved in cell wall biosynthesis
MIFGIPVARHRTERFVDVSPCRTRGPVLVRDKNCFRITTQLISKTSGKSLKSAGQDMARFLVVGNLSKEQTPDIKAPWDIRVFFSHPEAEFLNTGPGPDIFAKQNRPTRSILADVKRNAYDLIIVGNTFYPAFNPRKNWGRNAANFVKKIVRHPNLLTGAFFHRAAVKTPFVGLDMEDTPIVDNSRFPILGRSVCYFKRELPQNPCNAFLYTTSKTQCNGNVLNLQFFRESLPKLRPISVGVDDETCRSLSRYEVPKKTDVFFSGNCSNRLNRQRGLRQLEAMKAEGYSIDIAYDRLSREEFLRRCAQAYIVWSPEGFGWDCFRHYEVSLVASVPLMQAPPIYRHAPLEDDVHGIYYYVEQNHLAVRVRQALQNRKRLAEMGIAARRHVLEHHTLDALSRYVVEEVRRTLDARSETTRNG